MAAVGSSVGLGNLWRFSSEAGSNGGGAFIFIYLLAVVLVCIPVLMSEYMVGRAGPDANAVGSVTDVARRSGVSSAWSLGAWIGMIAGFLIVTFYCVIAGWVLRYVWQSLSGGFTGLDADAVGSSFVTFIAEPMQVLPWFLVFAVITTFLVSRGVNKGIELAAKVLMPLFFVLLALLAAFALISNFSNGGTMEALKFLYQPRMFEMKPDPVTGELIRQATFSGEVAAAALGQAFFSVGVGSAIMITYGSYIPKDVSIPRSALLVGLTDTAVALIAGLAIFPIVFGAGLDASAGPGLLFVTLPNAFNAMGAAGPYIGAAFFFLAFFAAITSSVSLLEPSVAYVNEKFQVTKAKAAWIMGAVMTAIGLISVFGVRMDPVEGPQTYALDAIDGFTGKVMLPLAGLIIVIFVGWRLNKVIINGELREDDAKLGKAILFLTRWIAPIFVGLVLIVSVYDQYFSG
jgi:NSS family neurotransmitter:Na+ symporter